MKKILIISDGSTGAHFIQRAIHTYTSENIYYIVETKAREYEDVNPAKCKFYEFDPTSLYKISNLLKMEFVQVFIAMNTLSDVQNSIKNIRSIRKNLRIIVLNRWDVVNEDPNIVFINANEILSSKFLDYLPNVPVIAQNVGIGEGEIMEVLVPFGSSFVYRHVGAIEQKSWRIVAIYRNRELIMPERRKMIQPNDLLVLVGEPSVLMSVYRAIKRELGQFPEPFGSNLYIYLDMNIVNEFTLKEFLHRAIYIYSKFKHNLIIKVVNIGDVDMAQYIKSFAGENIVVDIDYDSDDIINSFHRDIKAYHIGLIIIPKEIFSDYYIREMLYEAHTPVLKLANKDIESVKDTALILSENRDFEKISTAVFDVSGQLEYNIELYNYLSEHQVEKEQVIEHYNNLSTIFSKSITIKNSNENPIKELKEKDNFLQILPFTIKMTKRELLSIFSTDSERLYHKLDEYHQLFIPVQL